MSFDALIQKGWDLFHARRYELALEPAVQAAGLEPENARAPYLRSIALTNLGRYEEAIVAADETLALAPDWELGHFARGFAILRDTQRMAYLDNGRLDRSEKPPPRLVEAEQHLREAIRIDPQSSSYWDTLGEILHVAGRLEQADDASRRSIELDPNDAWQFTHLARILRERDKLADAETACQHGLAIDPNNSVLHWLLGWLRIELRRAGESLPSFKESLRLWPHATIARKGLLEALRAEYRWYRLVQGGMIRLQAFCDRPARPRHFGCMIQFAVFLVSGILCSFLLPIPNPIERNIVAWMTALVITACVVYTFIAAWVVYFVLMQASGLLLLANPFGRLVLTPNEKMSPVLASGFILPLVIGYPLLKVISELSVPESFMNWFAGICVSFWLVTPALACWSVTIGTPRYWLGRVIASSALLLWLSSILMRPLRTQLMDGPRPVFILLMGLLILHTVSRKAKI